jgi:hypothetical protein
MRTLSFRWLAAAALALAGSGLVVASQSASASSSKVTTSTLTLTMPKYTPVAPPGGGTDDYHCTLLNPNLKKSAFITSSTFSPGSLNAVEVHHAILFLVPPQSDPEVEALNNGGKGWTCFGETVIPNSNIQIPGTTSKGAQPSWLSGWAPGAGTQVAPKGTGTPFPAGSLVVMQIHYNMLVGTGPVQASLTLKTVPATTALKPLSLDLFPAPPDVPCLAKYASNLAKYPLCKRSASLAYLGKRFGQSAINFDDGLEFICGRSETNPPASDTTSCTWTYHRTATILEVMAHEHLTGQAMKVTLTTKAGKKTVLLNNTDFNFELQRAVQLKKPVKAVPGDKVTVSCTYNPEIAEVNPQLRDAPKQFVVWGDGSSDEMCLALITTVSS